MPNDLVTITVRLKRERGGLYSRLRDEAESHPDANGRASIGNVIVHRLEDSFAREAEPGPKSKS